MGKKLIHKLKDALCSLHLLLSPWRVYDVYIGKQKHDSYEDPKCPSSWRGSGCCDIDLYGWDYELYIICARSESEARAFYEAWCEKTYNEVLQKNISADSDGWARQCAVEKAIDASNKYSTILGVMPSSLDKDECCMEHGEVEYQDGAEGDWSREETEPALKDAFKALRYCYAN